MATRKKRGGRPGRNAPRPTRFGGPGTYTVDCKFHATPAVHRIVPASQFQWFAGELESDAAKILTADRTVTRATYTYSQPGHGTPTLEAIFVFSPPRGRVIHCNIFIRVENEPLP